jgi:translation initiation factor 2B subunit (eIF-2B alpha/beta/delta family)
MSPMVEIRVRDYCPSKQTDLWACHRMSEDDLFMLQDNKFAIGEVYRKLKNDIEAMKEQNRKEVLDSIMAKTKKQWENIEKSLSFYSNIVNPETGKSNRKVLEELQND